MRSLLGHPGFHTLILGRAFRVDDPSASVAEQPREVVPPRASRHADHIEASVARRAESYRASLDEEPSEKTSEGITPG